MDTAGQPAGPYIRADDVEDARVYTVGTAYDQSLWNDGEPFGPVAADWGDIGEVEDLLIDNVGNVVGVTVEVGGFLGVGQKTVILMLQDVKLDLGKLRTTLTKEQIEKMPDFNG